MTHRFAFTLSVLCLMMACTVRAEHAPRAFTVHSMLEIRAEQAGKPYVLALWSVYCEPCRDELALLGRFKAENPSLTVIVVAADPPEDAPSIANILAQFDLAGIEHWSFADAFVEPLRYAIDPRWRGELPRTYLFDADHNAKAVAGRLDAEALAAWLKNLKQR
jgi:thiol-disulfide isomerase/thioredoxin